MPTPLNGATLRIIAQSLGLHRAADLAHVLNRNERTVKRYFAEERPIGPDVASTVRTWQRDSSQAVEAALKTIDDGASPVRLTRYPSVSALRRHQPDRGIIAQSSETWDAYLARIIAVLEDRGISYTVSTRLD